MLSIEYVLLTILGCSLATWLSRIIPFVILKKFTLSKRIVEFLSFVPVAIMSALWFESLFIQHIGHFPTINFDNLLASIPTVLTAVISKNLLLIVLVGVLTLAIVNYY
jgi:branched-subunit amino acid transport protein